MGLYVVDVHPVVQLLRIRQLRKGAVHWGRAGFPYVLSIPFCCKELYDYSAIPVQTHWKVQNIACCDHDLFGSVSLAMEIGHVLARHYRLVGDDGREAEERRGKGGYPSQCSAVPVVRITNL